MLQTGLGYGPLDAGLRLMPWTITFITVAPLVGALVDRLGERPFMVGGLTLQALGMGWIALIADPELTYSQFLLPSIVAGIGSRWRSPRRRTRSSDRSPSRTSARRPAPTA
jgi:MFS family permease